MLQKVKELAHRKSATVYHRQMSSSKVKLFCRRGCGNLECWQTRGLRSFLWIIPVSVKKPRISFDLHAELDTRAVSLNSRGSSFGFVLK